MQVFHMDVAKVDQDVAKVDWAVAYVAMVVHVCCKHSNVSSVFQTYVASVFIFMLHMFHTYVASVLSGFCICLQWLQVFF